jgi:hypothetical protein
MTSISIFFFAWKYINLKVTTLAQGQSSNMQKQAMSTGKRSNRSLLSKKVIVRSMYIAVHLSQAQVRSSRTWASCILSTPCTSGDMYAIMASGIQD